MAEFLEMGGYGVFVWSAYGFSALALIGLAVAFRRRHTRVRRHLEAAIAAGREDPHTSAINASSADEKEGGFPRNGPSPA